MFDTNAHHIIIIMYKMCAPSVLQRNVQICDGNAVAAVAILHHSRVCQINVPGGYCIQNGFPLPNS